jgi:omega-6 fatty acid desaturase (delta-12 desaturase)
VADEIQPGQPAARNWLKELAGYREPSHARSIFEILVTLVPFIGLWAAMYFALDAGYWLVLVLSLPTAGFLVRLFMIQHDCSHDAFFRARAANDWVGRCLGLLTLTPFDFWRRTHRTHHAHAGNLEHRGVGDVDTLTLREYQARSKWGRLAYRLYRHPAVLFGIGPAYLFILQHRIPFGFLRRGGWRPWASTMGTNVAIATAAAILVLLIGWRDFLLVQVPVTLIASSIGVWLFYVQHQFEGARWDHDEGWVHSEAALHGSSHYVLPQPLRWLSANIGVHHIHHLSSRIPFYRLPEVLADHPDLAAIGRVGLRESLACVRLALWDEEAQRLVPFRA